MYASFELTPDELNADFIDKVKALFQGKQKLAINITDSKDADTLAINFNEACVKVSKAKSAFDQDQTAQSVNETFSELRAHARSRQR